MLWSFTSINMCCCSLRYDQRGCSKQGGYSDRSVVLVDGEDLTEEEFFSIEKAFEEQL